MARAWKRQACMALLYSIFELVRDSVLPHLEYSSSPIGSLFVGPILFKYIPISITHVGPIQKTKTKKPMWVPLFSITISTILVYFQF